MSTNYAGSDASFPADVQLPDDGDVRDAASVNVGLQELADRTAYLNAGKIASQTVVRRVNLLDVAPYDASRWLTNDAYSLRTYAAADLQKLVFPLHLPHGCTLIDGDVTIDPGGAHSNLPQFPPKLSYWKIAASTAVISQIGTTEVDPSVSVVLYEARHTFSKTGLSEVIDNSAYAYMVIFDSEGGTDAQAGLIIWGLSVAFTTALRDPGAA